MAYLGRFAPSPTGLLHAGSLLAALASWLDARAHGGRWLVRIEDIDGPRCVPGAEQGILAQLAACGLLPDAPPLRQSGRSALYRAALDSLDRDGHSFACACTRREITLALDAAGQQHERFGERVYPGTCRSGLHGRIGRAVRLRTQQADGSDVAVAWHDRRLGDQQQNVTQEVGDFVLAHLHRDVPASFTYQLAVVVDDGDQGITDIVRGSDLADNTARQILLQQRLGLPRPRYLHLPLVCGADGHKLSKQNGAMPFDSAQPLPALQAAAIALGLPPLRDAPLADWLQAAVRAWADTVGGAAGGMMRTGFDSSPQGPSQ